MLGWEIFAAARASSTSRSWRRPDGQRLPLELQRDGAADLGVARAIDIAEDAFADAFEQIVVRDGTEHRSDGRSYFVWLRWPELDAARQASRRHAAEGR